MSINPRPTVGHTHPRPVVEQAASGLVPTGGAAGKVLKKISGTDYDYGWFDDNDSGGGGGGDEYGKRWPWDVLPAVGTVEDDQFNGAALDAKWLSLGGAGLTTSVKRSWLFMRATPTGATFDCRGIEQVLPAGNFSCATIMLLMANQYSIPAIHIRNTATNAMVRWAMFHNSGSTSDSWIGVHRYNALNNRTAIIAQTGFGLYEAAMRITNDGTNFRFDWSRDGYKWFNYVTEAVGTSFGGGMPNRIGLSLDPVSATLEGLAGFQAFRRSATATDGIGAFA